ncbi:MAG: DNA cytosine methyltransferase [Chloroflexota bacterium]
MPDYRQQVATVREPLRELSLFSGAGGGLLASLLLGWHTVGYVEIDGYCQRAIAARIKDGILHDAPIFGDLRTFISDGYAASYTGMVDVISGGFPCQPFSLAGKRAGSADERNLWPATIECIRVVRPRFAFLENVPGLLTSGYFGSILADLAKSGYDCRWRILSAAELGAPHKRDRLWIVAHTAGQLRDDCTTNKLRGEQGSGEEWKPGRQDFGILPLGSRWEIHQPAICREDDGLAFGVDRLRALGNGQLPIVAATAWRLLTDGL